VDEWEATHWKKKFNFLRVTYHRIALSKDGLGRQSFNQIPAINTQQFGHSEGVRMVGNFTGVHITFHK
jgi:hypothetical protein